MSRDKRGNGIQEVVSSILIGSTNYINKLGCESGLRVALFSFLTATLTATGTRIWVLARSNDSPRPFLARSSEAPKPPPGTVATALAPEEVKTCGADEAKTFSFARSLAGVV